MRLFNCKSEINDVRSDKCCYKVMNSSDFVSDLLSDLCSSSDLLLVLNTVIVMERCRPTVTVVARYTPSSQSCL